MSEDDSVEHLLTLNDLVIIKRALNEVCHGLFISKFEKKIGVSEDKVFKVYAKVKRMINYIK